MPLRPLKLEKLAPPLLQLKVIIITTLQLATRKVPMLVSIPPVSKISC
ncbi:hypothetical protein AWRI1631_41540 [Saccharomyces cerevisiae AWRI1631]|uniref:Uncharacterized protein n=1 Tax=Saccharomyces cerevisiae (strain AWRI1631) TaxID=545124 RepID=B5VFI4_YEAS6|nr:hypothetical protein AWRI1631_41540 [Saccharomyces cerevisiae AWRI1631]